jgi:anion-transporting  ArsA/GET3 family ATPase
MQSLLQRKLIVVAGKGGVGKTTITAAIGVLAARSGRRAILVEVGDQTRLPALWQVPPSPAGTPTPLQERLASISIDPDRALLEWLQSLGGRVSGRVLASSGTFQYFAAAAPGAKELVSMVKVWQLTRDGQRRRPRNELVVIDAPATGHALGMLRSPQTFGAIARIGPIASQTRQVQELLADPERTAYLAVSLASEMAVTETLELRDGLREHLGRDLDAVIANGLYPRRFSAAELQAISSLADASGVALEHATPDQVQAATLVRAAAHAAEAVHERARVQRNQLARLRRHDLHPVSVPHLFRGRMDLAAIESIADRLERRL